MKKKQIPMLILLCGYTLGIYKGYVALWKSPGTDPIRVFPYSSASLPLADQEILKHGIETEHPDDLLRLLEDYLS